MTDDDVFSSLTDDDNIKIKTSKYAKKHLTYKGKITNMPWKDDIDKDERYVEFPEDSDDRNAVTSDDNIVNYDSDGSSSWNPPSRKPSEYHPSKSMNISRSNTTKIHNYTDNDAESTSSDMHQQISSFVIMFFLSFYI